MKEAQVLCARARQWRSLRLFPFVEETFSIEENIKRAKFSFVERNIFLDQSLRIFLPSLRAPDKSQRNQLKMPYKLLKVFAIVRCAPNS